MDCSRCKGRCCKHVAIEIDKPETRSDFDDIRWYVAHKNIKVWANESDEWHVEFLTPCEHLDDDYTCKIYDKRPSICREYGSDDSCVFDPDEENEEEITFNSIEDVEKYIEENL